MFFISGGTGGGGTGAHGTQYGTSEEVAPSVTIGNCYHGVLREIYCQGLEKFPSW